MQRAALVLLREESNRRLVISWPTVPPGLRYGRLVAQWARLADVRAFVASRAYRSLLGAGIVLEDEDGTRRVAPEALSFIEAQLAAELRVGVRRPTSRPATPPPAATDPPKKSHKRLRKPAAKPTPRKKAAAKASRKKGSKKAPRRG